MRLKPRPREKNDNWLLIKSDDDAARHAGDPDILQEKPKSAKTGRTIEEVADDAGSDVWQSNRSHSAPETKPKALSPRERAAIVLRDLEGRSTAEVALILGSTETTIRSQISTGRVKMRNFVLTRMGRNV